MIAYFILGVCLLIGVVLLARAFTNADPRLTYCFPGPLRLSSARNCPQ
jgi:hypothetical protein